MPLLVFGPITANTNTNFNPHMNIWGLRGTRKSLIAAQTVIIGISESIKEV